MRKMRKAAGFAGIVLAFVTAFASMPRAVFAAEDEVFMTAGETIAEDTVFLMTEEAERVAKEKNRNPVKVNPENVDPVVDVATYYRGVCYLSINDFDSAIADFTACIDHEISVDDSRFNRGLSYLQKGDNEHAKEDLTECINNKYNEDASMFYRAYALLALGDNEGAIADLTKCIEHKYNLNQAYYQRAQIYKALGDEAHYIEDLEASLKEAE